MKKTTNYGLTLYDKEDKMSITAEENSLNANMKIIDNTLKEKASINDMTDYIEEHKEELKGKDGYTPVKGVDYFDGKNYVLTETDKEDISKLVEVNIPTKVSELENDKNYLSSIPLEYITENELSEKSYATESFVANKIAEAELSGSDVDLSGLATKDELAFKVDKVKGKSLVDDTEIERLKTVTNYDDTTLKNQINSKADKTDIPTVPTNISSFTNDSGYLTKIPSEYVTETELNNKGYLTEHQDLSSYAKRTEIPTKVSELDNDKNYLTTIPSEYVTDTELNAKGYLTTIPSEYVTETELNNKKYLTSVPSDYKTKTENDSLYQAKGNYLTSIPSEYVTETELSGKNYATKSELHSHSNKSVLDNTTASYTTAEKTKLAGLTNVTPESIEDALGYMPANTKEIEDLMTYKEDYIITPNINGYVQVSDLYFKTNSEAKRTDYISVYGYHRIEFTTKISKSGYAVLFFDENRVAMLSVSVVGTNSKQVIDMAIPDGAMFVICCQYQYSSATGRLYRTSNNDTANALGQLKKSAYTFKGKKAMFFGDSITYDGNMYRNNLLDRTEMVGIYCFAQNGARLANYSDTVMDGVQVSGDSHNNTVPNQVQHLLNNLTTYTDVPDIIIVSAATNGGDSEEGLDEAQYTDSNDAYIDIDTVDIKTFSGAMRWIYEKLKELYPDAIICFATPIQSANGGSRTFAKLSRKAECIRQNCERLCTPCIDAFRKSGINARYEVASASGKYLKDGLHPNSAGAVVLAKCYHKELANALID